MQKLRERCGNRIASVVHLAAYFDFTGEPNQLYDKVNVEGSRRLIRALHEFDVEQFVFSSTMLLHAPTRPGSRIDEEAPLAPAWAYPESKARTEEALRESAGEIPLLFLRLAGLYYEHTAIPTLSEQIARIYERRPLSHLFAGNTDTGQSYIHREDLLDLFELCIARRGSLESGRVLLAGEPDVMSYQDIQTRVAELIHGAGNWQTVELPATVAKAGAAMRLEAERLVPASYDEGKEPFIRPFMIDLANAHYALDITRVRNELGWEPRHRIEDGLEALVAALKDDPLGWYRANGVAPPVWLRSADEASSDADALRRRHEKRYRIAHRQSLWAHWVNMGLGLWLMTAPPLIGIADFGMITSNLLAGALIVIFAALSMSWRLWQARWITALLGIWVMLAPLLFWTPSAAAYLNGTLVGMLVTGFAVALPPPPGVSLAAEETGPTRPKGWNYSPSDWLQRLPVIILAVVGLIISRYLTAYQLDSVDGVWDPLFAGEGGLNGTETIITSEVSRAWPVPDAGIGALTYALEILVGAIGSSRRWRTMPWLVVLFGILIVPLGAVSILFIVIQPIQIGTYCTLCLLAALAMAFQIPFSVDELVATYQFLRRRHQAGRPWLRILFTGDTDEGPDRKEPEDFERGPLELLKDMGTGGIAFSWSLMALFLIGVALMLAPAFVGWESPMASSFHICGALVMTISVASLASVARLLRFLNMVIGVVLVFAPFVAAAGWPAHAISIVAGLLLIGLSVRRGPIRGRYGDWDRFIR